MILYNFFLIIKSLYPVWIEAREVIYNKKMRNDNKLPTLDDIIDEFYYYLHLNQTLISAK